MNLVISSMKWIMLVSGALTCSMIYAAIAPEQALRSTFGETLEGAGGATELTRRCDCRYALPWRMSVVGRMR